MKEKMYLLRVRKNEADRYDYIIEASSKCYTDLVKICGEKYGHITDKSHHWIEEHEYTPEGWKHRRNMYY